MIISRNISASLDDFKSLMTKVDNYLNSISRDKPEFFVGKEGKSLEKEVFGALCHVSLNTDFENTIDLVSGKFFPDIVVAGYFGVEVKSTKSDKWTSIGSSILESSRIPNVEKIYLTFGKLGKPVKFLSRPYEDCLSDIAVTHYPRYKIDMRLSDGQTIFDKIGISYDDLRCLDDPVAPVSEYYLNKLQPGEKLWWAHGPESEIDLSPTIKIWNCLSHDEKYELTISGFAYFPEIVCESSSTKYNNYSLWLVSNHGVVNNNVRDQFSAGGKKDFIISDDKVCHVPAVIFRLLSSISDITNIILNTEDDVLKEYWQVDEIQNNKIKQWYLMIEKYSSKAPKYEELIEYAIIDI